MQTVKIRTSDGKILEIDKKIAMMSNTIKKLIEARDSNSNGSKTDDNEPIPLPNVTAAELGRLLPWLEHHKNDPPSQNNFIPGDIKNISQWDQDYFKKYTLIQLFANINVANNLDIKDFLDTSSKLLAQMIVGNSPEDIQKLFNARPPPMNPVVVDDDKSTSNPEASTSEEKK